jgi:hypothetical protein
MEAVCVTEHEVREKIVRTVDTCFSDLHGDPFIAQRIRNGEEGEIIVKKKLSFGLVFAIVLILTTVAVAIAATQLGWVDYFGAMQGITVPKTAQEALNATAPLKFQVGPMTFTFNQLLTDKRIVMSSAKVHTTDGSEVLYADDTNVYEAVDAISSTVLERYNLDSGLSWLDAAKQLNLPLYGVRALAEIGEEYGEGSAMEDAMWNEDGSIVYFNMPMLTPKSVKDELPVTLYMSVTQFDPSTGDTIGKWQTRENITLPVAPLLAEKTYLPEGDAELDGMKLSSVYAEQYVTGIYLTSTFTVKEGTTADSAMSALYNLTLCDGEGNTLPAGLNMSGSALTDELPTVKLETMTSAETLPDSMIVTDGTVKISVK